MKDWRIKGFRNGCLHVEICAFRFEEIQELTPCVVCVVAMQSQIPKCLISKNLGIWLWMATTEATQGVSSWISSGLLVTVASVAKDGGERRCVAGFVSKMWCVLPYFIYFNWIWARRLDMFLFQVSSRAMTMWCISGVVLLSHYWASFSKIQDPSLIHGMKNLSLFTDASLDSPGFIKTSRTWHNLGSFQNLYRK